MPMQMWNKSYGEAHNIMRELGLKVLKVLYDNCIHITTSGADISVSRRFCLVDGYDSTL
jgi:hypothetical protein